MDASCAGKTTCLDVLAQRKHIGVASRSTEGYSAMNSLVQLPTLNGRKYTKARLPFVKQRDSRIAGGNHATSRGRVWRTSKRLSRAWYFSLSPMRRSSPRHPLCRAHRPHFALHPDRHLVQPTPGDHPYDFLSCRGLLPRYRKAVVRWKPSLARGCTTSIRSLGASWAQ